MTRKLLTIGIIFLCAIQSIVFAQDKIVPIFPDNTFYNYQMGQSRVAGAHSRYNEKWKKLFTEKGLEWPCKNILFRVFKYNQEFEVWAKNSNVDTFTLVKQMKVCVQSGKVGPKRAENDRQVPEGYYFLDEFKTNSNYWLSMLVSYPNYSDLIKGNKDTPGGEIYVHGSCVTVGCLPMTDEGIEELYCLAMQARTNGQYHVPIHIFPLRFDKRGLNILGNFTKDATMQKFWVSLKQGCDLFESNHKLFPVMYDTNGNYIY
jgi:murein L,D-transpeptidase YafK